MNALYACIGYLSESDVELVSLDAVSISEGAYVIRVPFTKVRELAKILMAPEVEVAKVLGVGSAKMRRKLPWSMKEKCWFMEGEYCKDPWWTSSGVRT